MFYSQLILQAFSHFQLLIVHSIYLISVPTSKNVKTQKQGKLFVFNKVPSEWYFKVHFDFVAQMKRISWMKFKKWFIFKDFDPLGLYLLQHMFYIVHICIFSVNFQIDLHFLDIPSRRRGPWTSVKRGV